MPAPDLVITILHFDDEVETVSGIPDALFNLYTSERAGWVSDGDCRYKKYVEEFVIRAPNHSPVRIRYVLTAELEACRQHLTELNPQTDVAIFDLMREDPGKGQLDAIGKELYLEARRHGLSPERVFILSGFPNIIAGTFRTTEYDSRQLLQKPISTTDIAGKLARLLPTYVRLDT